MPDRLILRLASDGGLAWLRQGGAARAPASTAGAPPASALAGAGEVVVLVPAEDVLLTEVRLSARNRAQLMQALPYAIEEQLLSPVEDLQFAAARGGAEPIGVAVVAKATMRGWLERLDGHGIRPDVVLPESLALPAATAQRSILLEEGRAVVRLGPWSAFSCSLAELPQWLAQAQETGLASPLEVHDFRSEPALELPVPVAAYHGQQRDALAFLAAHLGTPALNLLDGEFATAHRGARGARWWRVAAMLAAAVIVLSLANLGFEVLQLSRSASRIDALAEEALRKAIPEVDAAQLARRTPEQLMRGRLEQLRGSTESSGLLRVLAQIAPVLGSTTRIQSRGMEYRNGTLELALRAPDVAALDLIRERFAQVPGLKVDVTAANPGAEGVDGRIRIVPQSARGAAP